MLSVTASSIDRRFVDRVVLGNGKTIVGSSINTFPPVNNVTLAIPINGSCDPYYLVGDSYKGAIIAAGAAPDAAFIYPLPTLVVSENQFDEIMACANSTSNPVGTIETTVTTVNAQALMSASFSSPGPNIVTPDILKIDIIHLQPDLSAPGVDIIASWSLLSPPSDDPNDQRRVQYSVNTGTSMACPHASGAAAYVKSVHRDWSPAMIISALITKATPMNTPGNAGTNDLKYGSGQLKPTKARDPGLVYDASEGDYIAMLCTQGYNATQLALIVGSNATACSNGTTTMAAASASDLNYLSMAARVEPGKSFTLVFPRTVTNVGASGVAVLEFSAQTPKASFTVTVSGVVPPAGPAPGRRPYPRPRPVDRPPRRRPCPTPFPTPVTPTPPAPTPGARQVIQIAAKAQANNGRKEIANIAAEISQEELEIPAKKPSILAPPKEADVKQIDLGTADPSKMATISAHLSVK
ncbi:subtilisin-like protease SBT4.9 [Miscanthus floridulus]|uniref:subtilisin-like protease SBT4.9 n=1 Tax=Miscanthus floridulus TaxID=154761 RepID=UPI0034591D07